MKGKNILKCRNLQGHKSQGLGTETIASEKRRVYGRFGSNRSLHCFPCMAFFLQFSCGICEYMINDSINYI